MRVGWVTAVAGEIEMRYKTSDIVLPWYLGKVISRCDRTGNIICKTAHVVHLFAMFYSGSAEGNERFE